MRSDTYLLQTEFEGRTVNYGLHFLIISHYLGIKRAGKDVLNLADCTIEYGPQN